MANVLIFRLFLGTLQVHSSVALGALEHNRHYPLQLTDMHLMRNRCERRTATGSAASCVALTHVACVGVGFFLPCLICCSHSLGPQGLSIPRFCISASPISASFLWHVTKNSKKMHWLTKC